ncbi:hypothetical protein ONE63_009564 [Megalurothrips usitatus]|uniref:Uncharacterized protein n=1 Tax=Megalurothrips usitatus TaxID=439358 RepID=A0AAV7XLE3_9NEOP|nr:hypothetical protein ONE63_009564 [Megalurothrips usitatus]
MAVEQLPMWASVKFEEKYGSKCLNLPISHIMCSYVSKKGKDKRKPFEPAHCQDFEHADWYLAFVGENDEFQEERHSYPAYNVLIGRLAVTLDGLTCDGRKRIHWPNVPEKGRDPESSVETGSSASDTGGVSQQKAARQEKRKRRREVTTNDMEAYVLGNSIDGGADDTVESLREKIKRLEAEKERLQASFSSNSSGSQSELSMLLNTFIDEFNRGLRSVSDSLIASLTATKAAVEASLTATKAVVEAVEGKVDRLQEVVDSNQEKLAAVEENMSKSPQTKRRYVQNWIDQIPRD